MGMGAQAETLGEFNLGEIVTRAEISQFCTKLIRQLSLCGDPCAGMRSGVFYEDLVAEKIIGRDMKEASDEDDELERRSTSVRLDIGNVGLAHERELLGEICLR